MSRLHKQPFVFTAEFVVRKSFVFNGETLESGDDFVAEDWGCDARKLRKLYEANYLMMKEQKTTEDDEEEKKRKKAERKAARKSRGA